MTKVQKITLKISLCPTAMEQGDQGDLLDEAKVFDAIRAAAILKWPDCQVIFSTLQVGHRQGEEWARCWVDGEREDSQADSLLGAIDWSNERLYQKKGGVSDEDAQGF